jgi:hypothetical protein
LTVIDALLMVNPSDSLPLSASDALWAAQIAVPKLPLKETTTTNPKHHPRIYIIQSPDLSSKSRLIQSASIYRAYV